MHAETRTHTDRLTHTDVNAHHTKCAHTQSHVSVLTRTCTHPHLHTYTYSGDTCIHHPLMDVHTNAMWARAHTHTRKCTHAHTFLRTCTRLGWQAGPWTEISLGRASMLAPRWHGWASSAPSRPVFPLCCLRKRSHGSRFSPVHSVCSAGGPPQRDGLTQGSSQPPRAVPREGSRGERSQLHTPWWLSPPWTWGRDLFKVTQPAGANVLFIVLK